jgi:3D (Asp-Asp-Asp) domain-containing protein
MTGITVEKFERNWARRAKFRVVARGAATAVLAIMLILMAFAIGHLRGESAARAAEIEKLRDSVAVLSAEIGLMEEAAGLAAAGPEATLVSLGEFKIYHYAPTGNRTATGTVPKAGRTVAVDPEVIPLGSEIIVDGHSYIAEDTGRDIKGNTLDIFVSTRAEALQLGVKYAEVFAREGAWESE